MSLCSKSKATIQQWWMYWIYFTTSPQFETYYTSFERIHVLWLATLTYPRRILNSVLTAAVQFISPGAKKSSSRMSHIRKVQQQNLPHQKSQGAESPKSKHTAWIWIWMTKRPGVTSDGNCSCLIRKSGYGLLFPFPVGGNGNNTIYPLLST